MRVSSLFKISGGVNGSFAGTDFTKLADRGPKIGLESAGRQD